MQKITEPAKATGLDGNCSMKIMSHPIKPGVARIGVFHGEKEIAFIELDDSRVEQLCVALKIAVRK